MYTMVLSILHRATGLFLSFGSLILVGWLAAAALGQGAYARFAACAGSLPVRLIIAASLAAACYHLFAGLRHLAWDAGYGFEKRAARASGALALLAATSAFAALLWLSPAGRWLGFAP